MSAKTKRISSLFRELAEAFDQLDAEEKKPRAKLPRERMDHAADDAARRVRDGLRKQGVRLS